MQQRALGQSGFLRLKLLATGRDLGGVQQAETACGQCAICGPRELRLYPAEYELFSLPESGFAAVRLVHDSHYNILCCFGPTNLPGRPARPLLRLRSNPDAAAGRWTTHDPPNPSGYRLCCATAIDPIPPFRGWRGAPRACRSLPSSPLTAPLDQPGVVCVAVTQRAAVWFCGQLNREADCLHWPDGRRKPR